MKPCYRVAIRRTGVRASALTLLTTGVRFRLTHGGLGNSGGLVRAGNKVQACQLLECSVVRQERTHLLHHLALAPVHNRNPGVIGRARGSGIASVISATLSSDITERGVGVNHPSAC